MVHLPYSENIFSSSFADNTFAILPMNKDIYLIDIISKITTVFYEIEGPISGHFYYVDYGNANK